MSHGSRPYYTEETFRFTDKLKNDNERENYRAWFTEQIDIHGQEVQYHVYNYPLSGHDPIYGEQPSANFYDAVKIVMYLELNEGSIILSKFGLQGDDDVTAYIAISSFSTNMSALSVGGAVVNEPKAGDVFTLSEYGYDRPNARGGKSFQITQRIDQESSTINPLAGNYVWQINATRLDYTFEPGLTAEKSSDQVYDSSFSGRLSGYTNPQTDTKTTTDDVDKEAKTIFDYTDIGDGDDVYGDYY